MVPGDHFILTGSFKPDCLHTNVILERRETKLLWRERIVGKVSLHIIIIVDQIAGLGVNEKSIIIIIVKVISMNLMWYVSLSTLITIVLQCTGLHCEPAERERESRAIFNSLYFKRSFWFFYLLCKLRQVCLGSLDIVQNWNWNFHFLNFLP